MNCYLKYIGILLISVSCIAVGIIKAINCTEKIYLLETVRTCVANIKQRLIFTLATPEDLIQMLMEDDRFKRCEFISCAANLSNSLGFEKGWKKSAANQLMLNREERELICSIANILGKSDLETQIKQLEIAEEQLYGLINSLKFKLTDSKRIYIMLGFLSSITITVLLI